MQALVEEDAGVGDEDDDDAAAVGWCRRLLRPCRRGWLASRTAAHTLFLFRRIEALGRCGIITHQDPNMGFSGLSCLLVVWPSLLLGYVELGQIYWAGIDYDLFSFLSKKCGLWISLTQNGLSDITFFYPTIFSVHPSGSDATRAYFKFPGPSKLMRKQNMFAH